MAIFKFANCQSLPETNFHTIFSPWWAPFDVSHLPSFFGSLGPMDQTDKNVNGMKDFTWEITIFILDTMGKSPISMDFTREIDEHHHESLGALESLGKYPEISRISPAVGRRCSVSICFHLNFRDGSKTLMTYDDLWPYFFGRITGKATIWLGTIWVALMYHGFDMFWPIFPRSKGMNCEAQFERMIAGGGRVVDFDTPK